MSDSVGVRVQGFAVHDQVVVIAQLAQARSDDGTFAPREIERIFDEIGLPNPGRAHDLLRTLARRALARSALRHGAWRLTPEGQRRASDLVSEIDLAALAAAVSLTSSPTLGTAAHPLVPPTLAPPDLLTNLRLFLEDYDFERNVFGMTRFPEASSEDRDPLGIALTRTREICAAHGLAFHLASDRALHDDLWSNVAAHMWACKFGIAFFEDRLGQGVNYNLTIEVGSMLMTGRRCALLKDSSIDSMPTDLVGRIFKPVDLKSLDTIEGAAHSWLRDDLGLGACPECHR